MQCKPSNCTSLPTGLDSSKSIRAGQCKLPFIKSCRCASFPRCAVQDLHDYLQATIQKQSAPEEAFRRFDELATRHVELLRRLTKQIQVWGVDAFMHITHPHCISRLAYILFAWFWASVIGTWR